jgi:hypothetical protein
MPRQTQDPLVVTDRSAIHQQQALKGPLVMRESTWEVLSFAIPALLGLAIVMFAIFAR